MYRPNFPSVPFRLGLYPIVDNVVWIKKLLEVGVHTLQLRIKNKCNNEVESDIADAISLGYRYNARLFINDYWRLAIKYQAWGVHLGQKDQKDADLKAICKAQIRLGISTHNKTEIDTALKIRPSYIALGHIFPTKSKHMSSSPQGLEKLAQHVKYLSNYPTVAIGGIDLDRVPDVLATGVGSIAVISAITQAKNWKVVTKKLLELMR